MGNVLNNIYNIIMDIVNNSAFFGPLFACLLIYLESMIPILPLFVFITITFMAYGYFFGFIISYILTSLGCFSAFFLCRKFFKNYFQKKVRKNPKFDKLMRRIDKIKLTELAVLIAIPFTPAFLVNIASSLSEMSFKKFMIAILIGKISLVFFWGFIGTSLVESLKNPKIIIVVIILLLLSYLLSKIVNKKLKIE